MCLISFLIEDAKNRNTQYEWVLTPKLEKTLTHERGVEQLTLKISTSYSYFSMRNTRHSLLNGVSWYVRNINSFAQSTIRLLGQSLPSVPAIYLHYLPYRTYAYTYLFLSTKRLIRWNEIGIFFTQKGILPHRPTQICSKLTPNGM